ncbi:peroxidase 12-like [Solanum dulcamara]|uniref:peroxidase 12-like n=1 Tax=Solanum dulcamara TaxID=45834 RepID=UPI002485A436|nr:peroxidase 12-like [Solanum dulcamara]
MVSSTVASFLLVLVASFFVTEAQRPALVKGLSWSFLLGQAAGLLRLYFHDCFVQRCDSSVLLDGSAGGPSEQTAIPNLTLRKKSFKIIDDLRKRIQAECGQVVSCSDITAIAARDSVVLTGGPNYDVPLGRKDGLNFATEQATIDNLVAPFANTTTVLARLAVKGLDATDAVALSGAHTIGISHCTSFTDRLYPNQDSTMDKTFANNLKRSCPTADSNNTVNMDIRSPNVFDNKYFVDLMNRQGLFTSDQDLYTDRRTRGIVTSFAVNQSLFYEKFVIGMIKMGQLNVLTGGQGEIRNRCDRRNKDKKVDIATVVEELEETFSALF